MTLDGTGPVPKADKVVGPRIARFTGVTGVCPVLEVPFTSNGDVDEEGFLRVARHVMRSGVSSVMFPGFASEYHKLDDSERTRLTDLLLQVSAAEDIPAVISVPDHATTLAVRRAREVAALGAAAINVLPPHLLSPARREVLRHVATVLDAVPRTPVVLQYAPALTGMTFDAEDLRRLAQRHDAGFQVKVEVVPPGPLISALAGGEQPITSVIGYAGVQLPDALRRGAVGVQPGCSFSEIYVEIWQRWHEGRIGDAVHLHRRLLPYLASWMQEVELVVQVEKTISARRGLIEDDHCRAPRRALDTYEAASIDEFMRDFADFLPPVS